MIARLLSIFLALVAAYSFGGCASKDKSSAALYHEDAPSMRYQDRQAPGQRIDTHRYR